MCARGNASRARAGTRASSGSRTPFGPWLCACACRAASRTVLYARRCSDCQISRDLGSWMGRSIVPASMNSNATGSGASWGRIAWSHPGHGCCGIPVAEPAAQRTQAIASRGPLHNFPRHTACAHGISKRYAERTIASLVIGAPASANCASADLRRCCPREGTRWATSATSTSMKNPTCKATSQPSGPPSARRGPTRHAACPRPAPPRSRCCGSLSSSRPAAPRVAAPRPAGPSSRSPAGLTLPRRAATSWERRAT